ncbi:MAG: 7TM domain-containing protein [Candidatus Gracilibacteria bacterium]|nr:7TM domain-containing protein [Candidatus Gracilibacteria bacterium]
MKVFRRISVLCFVFLLSLGMPISAMAQELEKIEINNGEQIENLEKETPYQPTIRSGDSVQVGRNIIFAADNVEAPDGYEVREFLWEFGDGEFSSREEVVHIYREPGRYNVKLQASFYPSNSRVIETVEFTKEIFVYERTVFLLTDLEQSLDRIEALQATAEDQNVYLNLIRSSVNMRLKNRVLKLIERKLDEIQESDSIIIWSDSVELLTLLNTFSAQLDLSQKDFVVITDGNIGFLKTVAQGVNAVLGPKRIILTRREAVDEFFTKDSDRDVTELIMSRGYDISLLSAEDLNKVDLWALPSLGIRFLQEKGVEDGVLLLVLFLPVIVTLVTFLKVVIGFSSAGARVPIIFAYSLIVLGWKLGLITIVILAIICYLFRLYVFRRHLLYVAKVGILTSFNGLVLLFIIGMSLYFDFQAVGFSSALMMIILASIVDRLVGVEGEKGLWSIMRIFFETLFISLMCFWVVSLTDFQLLLMAHSEVLILFIVANIFMGRFTGLRLMEYFRFREILRYTEE